MLIAEELTEQVIGLAIKVCRRTGPGLLESAYEQCLCDELREAGIPFERQVGIPVIYKAMPIGEGFRADIVVACEGMLRSSLLPPSCRRMKRNCAPEVAGLDPAIVCT